MLLHFIFAFTSLFALHDYHVGIYEIDIVDGQFQISMKLFTDDFERALKQKNESILFSEEKDGEALQKAIEDYIASSFIIEVEGKSLALEYLGMEWEDHHVVYLYWQSDKLNDFQEFTIFNRIFLDVAPEQENMHRISKGDQEISLGLNRSKVFSKVDLVN